MQAHKPVFEANFVLRPCDPIHTGSCPAPEREEAGPELIGRHVVEQGGEPSTPIQACCLSHASETGRRALPAPCPGRGGLTRVPLGRPPSLHPLRQRGFCPALVRGFRRYYAAVRLPRDVHAGLLVCRLPRPTLLSVCDGYPWDLPVPGRRASPHAQGLRLRGVRGGLARRVRYGVAFRLHQRRRHPGPLDFAAQYLACGLPCQRFTANLTIGGT